MTTKIQEMNCAHKGCPNKHKSTTGYCHEHVQDMERGQRADVTEGRANSNPSLYEERGGGFNGF